MLVGFIDKIVGGKKRDQFDLGARVTKVSLLLSNRYFFPPTVSFKVLHKNLYQIAASAKKKKKLPN